MSQLQIWNGMELYLKFSLNQLQNLKKKIYGWEKYYIFNTENPSAGQLARIVFRFS